MKTTLTLILVFGFIQLMGQQPIEVKIEQRPSSVGIQTAFEMVVPQATSNDAIDLWKKTITPKSFLKKTQKMEKIKDEWWVNNILISDITTMPLNVITQVSSFPGQIYIRIFLQSEGGFLGSSGSSEQTTQVAQDFIRNYGVDLYRLAVGKELKDEERKLQVLEKDLKKLQKKNKTYDNKIEDARKDKASLANDADYQKRLFTIDNENPLGVIGETQQQDLEDQLKSTEKDLKKAEKTENKFNRRVRKNEKAQNDKAYEIEKQKNIVENVKIKLENIR